MDTATTTYIVLKELAGNPPPQMNAIQKFLEPHTELLILIWIMLWFTTLFVVLWKFWHEFKNRNKNR